MTHERRVLEALLGVPFTDGNRVEVLRNGDRYFPAMLAAIAAARRSVDLLWFVWGRGPVTEQFADALADRARAGLRVRVLLDGFGARGIDPRLVHRMRRAGCVVLFYRPLRSYRVDLFNLRTHRRVLVCDETLAFTGGAGIDQAWTGDGDAPDQWRDSMVRVEGPAVAGLRAAFALPWSQGPHPLVGAEDRFPALEPEGDVPVQVLRPASQPGWNDAAVAIEVLLDSARRQVRISTPYVRLSRRLTGVLRRTARRGVRICLLVPGPHVDRPVVVLQSQHDYAPLLDAGVEIWEYQPSMLHTKLVAVDESLAMVGTTNLDIRSLALNEQTALVLAHEETVRVLTTDFGADLRSARRVTPDGWRRRGLRQRVAETLAEVVGAPLRVPEIDGLTGRRP